MTLPLASIQLYTLAKEFSEDPNGSLEKLAAIGLKNVEAFDFVRRPAEIRAALDASGLASPTGHAPLLSDELWTPDGSIPTPAPEVVFEAAAQIGIQTVIDPFVSAERWLTEDGVADIADRLNKAAEVAATFGLKVGYHNHAQEFIASFDGRTAYERFVATTDERVEIELDLFWALTGGQDGPTLVSKLGSRLVAVHVKDGIAPAENPFAPAPRPSARTPSTSAARARATCRSSRRSRPARVPSSTPSSSTTTPPATSSRTSRPATTSS